VEKLQNIQPKKEDIPIYVGNPTDDMPDASTNGNHDAGLKRRSPAKLSD
jgi:hypothetical protein